MYDLEHHIDSSLLMNSEEEVIVVEQSIPVHDIIMEMEHVPMIPTFVDDNDEVINESNDNLTSTEINDVAISTDLIQLRQPIGPSGMVEELLRREPVVEDVAIDINGIKSRQPIGPSEMIEELLRPLADEEEIVLIQPNLSVPLTEAEKEVRLANLATILQALLMEQSNLLNSGPIVAEAATPVRTGNINHTTQPVEFDEDNDSKPAAIITPNTNGSDITMPTQENDTKEYD